MDNPISVKMRFNPFMKGTPRFASYHPLLRLYGIRLNEKSANRVMTVKAPVSGGFAVYDAKGKVVNFSKATSNHSVVLPEGGMIVFGGNEEDVFKINLNNE